jgi:hypothetical protein
VEHTETELATAVSQCKHSAKLDHFGLCCDALYMTILTNAGGWATVFARAFNTPRWLQAITVKGPIKAKHRCPVLPKDTRFLMPQPVLLQVMRNIVVNRLQGPIEARMKTIGCSAMIMGGTSGYQCTDIMGTIQLFVELSCDTGSIWSVTQSDIRQFFDSIEPLRLMRALIR